MSEIQLHVTPSMVYIPGDTSIIPVPISEIIAFVTRRLENDDLNLARLFLRDGKSVWSRIIPLWDVICLKRHLCDACGFRGYTSARGYELNSEFYGFRRGRYRVGGRDLWVSYDCGRYWVDVLCVHPADLSTFQKLIPELEEVCQTAP